MPGLVGHVKFIKYMESLFSCQTNTGIFKSDNHRMIIHLGIDTYPAIVPGIFDGITEEVFKYR
jgi:hypothetical protein